MISNMQDLARNLCGFGAEPAETKGNEADRVEPGPNPFAEPLSTTENDRAPNWRTGGWLYVVRCFVCEPERGRENYAPSVAAGQCAWCGWTDPARVKP